MMRSMAAAIAGKQGVSSRLTLYLAIYTASAPRRASGSSGALIAYGGDATEPYLGHPSRFRKRTRWLEWLGIEHGSNPARVRHGTMGALLNG